MIRFVAFSVLFLSVAVASATDQAAVSSPSPCNINNHNSFYAGPNKKVENLLTDMKKQLDELQRQVELLTKQQSANVCPKAWVRYGNSCFVVIDEKIPKWSDARKLCQDLGGDLAIIRSADENSFISDLLKKQRGLTEWGAWLGFYRKADNKFYWIDDTPLEGQYTAWNFGEPNNYLGGPEDCGNMVGTGTWNDLYCNLRIQEFWINNPHNNPFALCQKKSN